MGEICEHCVADHRWLVILFRKCSLLHSIALSINVDFVALHCDCLLLLFIIIIVFIIIICCLYSLLCF